MTGPYFGVAIAEEVLGEQAPVPFQGGLIPAMEHAAALGFTAVEFHIRDPHLLDAAWLRRRADALQLRVAAVGTGLEHSLNQLSLTDADPAVRAEAGAALVRHIDFARHFDAVVFLGLIRGKAGSTAGVAPMLDLLAQELIPVAEYAQEQGVRTGFEPVAYYFSDLLNTTAETLEFLSRPGLGSIGVLLDSHHMFLEDPDIPAAIRATADRLTHFHFSDSNRRYPGAGNVDFAEICQVLAGLGYQDAMSLEVLPAPTADIAAARGLAHMHQCWPAH
ncbi:MAG: sugar phosphate isomerase/epimerase family protein [Arachnia sp.]